MKTKKNDKYEKSQKKARDAVKSAADKFSNLGFQVATLRSVNRPGPDIEIFNSNGALRVEVKAAFKSRDTWRIGRTSRKQDDLIAIVFPNGFVHVEDMRDHLKSCMKDGERIINALGRLYSAGNGN